MIYKGGNMSRSRKIYLIGTIDLDMYARFTEELDTLVKENSKKQIYIELCSDGGDDTMYAFYDKIVNCTTPIHIYAYGSVQSAAVLVFAAGHKRFASPSTQFMVHESSTKLKGESSDLINAARQLELDEIKYCKLLEMRCTKTTMGTDTRVNNWRERCKETTYFDVREAVNLGLVNAD
jgi:ATP-dependent Clp protease, protease subunit